MSLLTSDWAGLKILLSLVSLCTTCSECEKAKYRDPKTVNWRYAKPGEFPWAVSLQWKLPLPFRHFCGGSLARPDLVLSACHCIMIRSEFDGAIFLADPKDRIVVAGSVNNNLEDKRFKSRISVDIIRFQAHPKCHYFERNSTAVPHGGWDYDMGWVHLARNVSFDGFNFGPFRLSTTSRQELEKDTMQKMVKNEKCVVVGWGKRYLRKTRNDDPREFWAELTVITVALRNFAACYNILCGYHKLYCDVDHWARRQVCATTLGDVEVCQGDSGGPLLCGDKSLYGVVGWGPNCGEDKGTPSVYATVYGAWDFLVQSLNIQARSSEPKTVILPTSSIFYFAAAVKLMQEW